jgi:hypothetical protein
MKRLFLGSFVLIAIGAAVVFSGAGNGVGTIFFPKEERNPVTHLRWNENDAQFQFAIVSDRTGGHRAEIFSQAVEKLNLMQPAFVMSVGDLIEGGANKPQEKLAAEWKEFDGLVNKLQMPFFYVPGNHDVAAKEAAKVWDDKLGRRHYHFVYRNTLFLMLNSNDPKGGTAIDKEQSAWASKVLTENAGVQYTIVSLHHPLWNTNNGEKNGWADVEKALKGRPYTVFCGHVHRYDKWVRQGMNYYQLATTGGSSKVRGLNYAEFDHFVWVTMKKDGPVLANIMLDKVYNEGLTKEITNEPVSIAKRRETFPFRGTLYFDGAPTPGAVVTLTSDVKAPAKTFSATGVVEGDGTFRLSTYTAFDGVPAGEYKVTATWRTQKGGPNLLPAKYATVANTDLRATVQAGSNELKLELKK